MNNYMLVGAVLVVAGILGLVYDQFSYTKETEKAKLGPIELTVKEQETVNIPVWAGASGIAIGAGLLVVGGMKR